MMRRHVEPWTDKIPHCGLGTGFNSWKCLKIWTFWMRKEAGWILPHLTLMSLTSWREWWFHTEREAGGA